jgi:hypothetical protein
VFKVVGVSMLCLKFHSILFQTWQRNFVFDSADKCYGVEYFAVVCTGDGSHNGSSQEIRIYECI